MKIQVAPIMQEDKNFMRELSKLDTPNGTVQVEIVISATLWFRCLNLLKECGYYETHI